MRAKTLQRQLLKLPSYKAMIDFVNEDGAAPILLDKERMEDIEFDDITDEEEDFLSKLKRDKNGTPEVWCVQLFGGT